MKAMLRLELIGDNTRQAMREACEALDSLEPLLGRTVIGRTKSRCWAAEILAPHPIYEFCREFLCYEKDYENANSVGSRGVEAIYILESGKVYEISAATSWAKTRRYFAMVSESGDICEIDKREVNRWLEQQSARSASTF